MPHRPLAQAVFAAGMSIALVAQTQDVRPRFEVGSVKLSGAEITGPFLRQLNPGTINYRNRNLFEYVQLAYGVQGYQVTHSSSISLADRYDIAAKAADPVPVEQVKTMLQVLLEERLNLKVHREDREIPVYALVVAKNGPRFHPAPEDEAPGAQNTGDSFVFRKSPISALTGLLTNMPSLGKPVFDRTGLHGLYDLTLRLDSAAGKTAGNGKAEMLRGMDEAVFSSLADLGLKLEPQKATVNFLVVDHVDKIPADN
ncbi:MAG TPA: TIGR03435 family protein [Bryobacteraceae bacterium]|jgi:uncharacterized protein (TIGR03435 family)|nr:TIGR03435 family protein [Bryobacteraceae bacterium]